MEIKDRLNFAVDNAEIIEENPDSNFAIISLDFFASGENLHELYVSEETLARTADTIKNRPLVWMYDPYFDDAYTHDMEEVPCGFVPEAQAVQSRLLPDGRTMLSVVAYVWKKYTGPLIDIFKRDGGRKPVSVEMIINSMKRRKDGVMELLDFAYEGITILGSYVTPAIPGANATVLAFSKSERDEYKKAYMAEFAKKGAEDTNQEMENSMKKENQKDGVEEIVDAVVPEDFAAEDKADEVSMAETEDMACGDKPKEDMAEEAKPEEEPSEDMAISVEIEEEPEDGEDEEEEMSVDEEKPEGGEEGDMSLFSYPEDFRMEALIELFSSEEEADVREELAKGEQADPAFLLLRMFGKLTAQNQVIAEQTAELEGLVTYRNEQETARKNFEVTATLEALAKTVSIPQEAQEEMLADAENFSLENLEVWKTACKAKALDFAIVENKKDDGKKAQVFAVATSDKPVVKSQKNDPWVVQKS